MLITKPIDAVPPRTYNNFSCGISELDEYLKRYAKKNHKNNIGKTFVYIENESVIGFYTINMSSVLFNDLPENCKAGVPKYPIPVAQIGRLAVHSTFQGKEIGSALLVDAFKRIKEASLAIAAFAVVVDAKNEKAKKFYKNFGFIEYKGSNLSLFIPMTSVNDLLKINQTE
jgi:predicted N-acetyltransferase YhbS